MLKTSKPKTTLWKSNGITDTLMRELEGLPFGTPAIGDDVVVPGFGVAKCIGISHTGSAPNSEVSEIRLRVA